MPTDMTAEELEAMAIPLFKAVNRSQHGVTFTTVGFADGEHGAVIVLTKSEFTEEIVDRMRVLVGEYTNAKWETDTRQVGPDAPENQR